MDSLEFDLHSQILSSLASTLAKDTATTANDVQRLIRAGPYLPSSSQPSTPQPQTNTTATTNEVNGAGPVLVEGGLMTIRHQHALVAQAKFAAESSGQFDSDLIPRLSSYLHSLSNYQYSDGFGLKGRSPADSLTYNLVSNLLTIAGTRPSARQQVLDSIWAYLNKLSSFVFSENADKICEFVLPSLNGLLAALETSTLEFEPRDFSNLVSHSNAFLSTETAESIRKAIVQVKQDSNDTYARRVLSQYAGESIVLSSNRVVLQVLTVKRNMIGCLIHSQRTKAPIPTTETTATPASSSPAFNDIWTSLLTTPVNLNTAGSLDLTKIMRTEYIMSLQFFADMRSFANELLAQGNVSYEFYYSEIMGISLITPIVLSMLAQQIRHYSPRLDCVIVSRLTDMALTGSENSFNDITQILSNIAKLSISPDNKPETKDLCEAVNACQLRLAKTINTRPEFYSAYLTCLLKLFVEKGVQIQLTVQANKKSQNKINSLSAGLGLLLPVLGALLSHDDFQPHLRPSKEDAKLFRDAWFHCVLFEFVKDSPWYREWSNSMLLIAHKTPAFVSGDLGTNAYLEGDLEYNSVLPRGLLDDQKASMRATLASYLPAQTYEIKSLTSAKVVFLLSVYHVETMRSRQGNCSFILKYFMNSGVNDTGLSNCLEAIADQVINVFMSEAQAKVVAHSLDDSVRQQVRNLVIACTHRLKKVSTLSSKWVQRMIVTFPQLMCDKALMTLVLELSELLWLSCENEMTDEYCPIYTFTSPKVGVTISLPDSYPYRRELLSKFVDLTRKWIAAAMAGSPQEVDALLQDYLAESEKIHSGISRVHMGRTLAARSGKDLVKNHNSFDSLANIPGAILDNSSVFFQEFSARRRYQGEIGGMETFSSAYCTHPGSVLQSQLPALRESLQKMLQQVKADQFVSNKDLANALHRAVSALVTLEKTEEDLVKMIAWIPIYLFTPDSLKIGTSVWNWLITEKPCVEKRLMAEVAAGWAWTSRHRKGLFSPLLDSEDPFRVRMEYAPSDKKARQKAYKVATYLFAPHVIWIEFLSSRFQATRYGNRDMVDIITRLLHLTFDHGFKMSTHPLAREGRFQLILLGLRLLQTNRMEALIEYRVRSALYKAALSWFELSPRWSFGGNRMISKSEARVMREFGQALEQDKIFLDMVLSSLQSCDTPTGISNNY
ncbi:phosphatidylinositol-4- kinase, partial [Podila horticola]